MSFLGIDIGTTGCKSAVVSCEGKILSVAYREYDHVHPQPGWAEFDARIVWDKAKQTIREAVMNGSGSSSIQAVCVTSLGEAVVPVTREKEILGPSILNYCRRGEEYAAYLSGKISNEELYRLTGNKLGTLFSMAKMMWMRDHTPEVYNRADHLLPWTSFISYMLGADPAVDYSLANRTLLFDINTEDWSDRLIDISGLDREKLPRAVQAGEVIGKTSAALTDELGLPKGIPIVIGAHDQCTNSVGCGSISAGQAMLGMGTFTCATPVFIKKYDPVDVIPLGVNTEHHAIKGHHVSFIYNQGGSVVKWYRDTFAASEHAAYKERGDDVYPLLFSEMPQGPARSVVLPYLTTTGLPDFSTRTSGVMAGLRIDSSRGEILKGIIESVVYDIKFTFDALEKTGMTIDEFITVGGGSNSDAWVQACADIFNKPMERPDVNECGVLGASIISAVSVGEYASYEEAVANMVTQKDRFTPNPKMINAYARNFEKFCDLRELTKDYSKDLSEK